MLYVSSSMQVIGFQRGPLWTKQLLPTHHHPSNMHSDLFPIRSWHADKIRHCCLPIIDILLLFGAQPLFKKAFDSMTVWPISSANTCSPLFVCSFPGFVGSRLFMFTLLWYLFIADFIGFAVACAICVSFDDFNNSRKTRSRRLGDRKIMLLRRNR
jgi:hypothetical protein